MIFSLFLIISSPSSSSSFFINFSFSGGAGGQLKKPLKKSPSVSRGVFEGAAGLFLPQLGLPGWRQTEAGLGAKTV
jgi:hypothetical protein